MVQRLLSLNYLYLLPLLAAALTGLARLRQPDYKPLRSFAWFLLASLITETLAIAWKWGLHHTALWNFPKSNLWIYNAFQMVQLVFYSEIFISLINVEQFRRVLRRVVLVLIVFGLLNYFFIEGPLVLNNISIAVFYPFFAMLSVICLFKLMRMNQGPKLRAQPATWIALGTLIYFSVALPYCLFLPFLATHNLRLAILLFNINVFLDTLMYSFYLIAFLCKMPPK